LITHIHHLGWVVASIDESLHTFRRQIGLELSEIEQYPGVRVAFLFAGPSMVELLQPLDGDSDLARFLATRGEGIHHVAYAVRDVARALTEATDRGLRRLDSEPRPGARGTLIAFVDPGRPDGVLIEYVQDP